MSTDGKQDEPERAPSADAQSPGERVPEGTWSVPRSGPAPQNGSAFAPAGADEVEDNASFSSLGEERIMPEDEYQSSMTLNELLSNYPDHFRNGDTIADHLPVPPDGGYGWVIVGASFFNNMVVDGIANSFGTFMDAYEREFGASKALTSFIGSLLIGSCLLCGEFGRARPSTACRTRGRRAAQQVRRAQGGGGGCGAGRAGLRHLHRLAQHLRAPALLRALRR